MFSSAILIVSLMVPGPLDDPSTVQWEGRFAFTGLYPHQFKDAKDQPVQAPTIVVQLCFPVYTEKPNWKEHRRFCKYAESITGRPDFCFTTGPQTLKRCRNKLHHGTHWYFDHGVVVYPNEAKPGATYCDNLHPLWPSNGCGTPGCEWEHAYP